MDFIPLFGYGGRGTLWTLRASGGAVLLPNWEKFAAQLGNKISPVREKRNPIFLLQRPLRSGCPASTAIRLRARIHEGDGPDARQVGNEAAPGRKPLAGTETLS